MNADGSPSPREECPIHASLLDGAIHHADTDVYWRKDGSSFPVQYTNTPIVEGAHIRRTVVVFHDVTERSEMERVKDEFTSMVSHELRTPLTSIRGSLGLLESGVLGPLSDRAQRMLKQRAARCRRRRGRQLAPPNRRASARCRSSAETLGTSRTVSVNAGRLALSQTLNKGQITAEEFHWRVMTLLAARPTTYS